MSDVYMKRSWDNGWEMLMSCLTMTLGLGNLWRFPYVCYKNGGGAFLLPYFVILILVGRPLYYLDLCMGQFSGRGSINMYKNLAPVWKGIGVTQCVVCLIILSYSAYILGICLFYVGNSFTKDLPWDWCKPSWGNYCAPSHSSIVYKNSSQFTSSSELFFRKEVLRTKDSIDYGLGSPNWKICLCLIVTWGLAFLTIFFGIKTSGKVAYFTTIFPILLIITLLIKTAMMPGSGHGMIYFLKPQWKKLLSLEIWVSATTQCFFSMGIGYGMIAMYASYNDIHYNLRMITFVIAVVDTLTSIISGLTIFAALGTISKRLDLEIDEVIKGDFMGLSFVTYPEAISHFGEISYVFALLFFLMLFLLGIGCIIAYTQVITTNLLEIYPILKEWHVGLLACSVEFFFGIIYTTEGGIAVYLIMDRYGCEFPILVTAMCQLIAICYINDYQEWCWNVEFMIDTYVSRYWKWTWAVISPIFILFCIYGIFTKDELIYEKQPMPLAAKIIAHLIFMLVCSPILIYFIYYVSKYRSQRETAEAFSSDFWLPAKIKDVVELEQFMSIKLKTYKYMERSQIVRFYYALIHI